MTTSATVPLAPLAPLAMMLRINETLISRSMDGLTDDQLWERPTDHNNPMLWLVGHQGAEVARAFAPVTVTIDLSRPMESGCGRRPG